MSLSIDSQLFRQTMGQFATGVTIVGFMRQGKPCGMTVNSFTSVSLEPPMILFCPALTTRFALELGVGDLFSVSILASDQADVSKHFGGGVCCECNPWACDERVPKIIADCLAWLRCKICFVSRQGDHLVVVGSVEEFGSHSDAAPLLFFRGLYPMLEG